MNKLKALLGFDPKTTTVKPVTETHNIDTEYPYFKNWADSWGSKSTDWYKRYQSPKN